MLVDHARERCATKRNGGCRIEVNHLDALSENGDVQLLALYNALKGLSRVDKEQGMIVEMKLLGGLSAPEISQVLGLSRATVDRDWAMARVWLRRELKPT